MTDWDITKGDLGQPETIAREFQVFVSEPAALSTTVTPFQQTYTGPIIMRTQALENYFNLHDAYVEVRFRVVTSAGIALAVGQHCTLINAGWHLFDRAVLKIGDQVIETVQNPGKVQLMEGMAKYSVGEFADTMADEWLYWPQVKYRAGTNAAALTTPNLMYKALGWAQPIDTTQLTSLAAAGQAAGRASAIGGDLFVAAVREAELRYNESYAKRSARSQLSSVVSLRLPLRAIIGFCDLAKPVHGLSIQLELTKNQDYAHILHAPANTAACATVIETCALWIPSCVPNKNVLLNIESAMQDSSAEWRYMSKTVLGSQIYPASTTRLDWNVGVLQDKPRLILVGIMGANQYGAQNDRSFSLRGPEPAAAVVTVASQSDDGTGAIQSNCSAGDLFTHLDDITRVTVRLNNKPFPQEQYQMSFNDETHMRAYYDFLDIWAKNRPESTFPVDASFWRISPCFAYRFDDKDVATLGNVYALHIEAQLRSSDPGALNADNSAPAGGFGDFRLYTMIVCDRVVYVRGEGGFFKMQIA
jgi:hypothetical protein